MGTPAPIYTPGDACAVCWGTGKPYGPNLPPKYCTVTIAGVEKADNWIVAFGEAVNSSFTLTQDDTFPCFYKGSAGGAIINCPLAGGVGIVTAKNSQGVSFFVNVNWTDCWTVLQNEQVSAFKNGTMTISFP